MARHECVDRIETARAIDLSALTNARLLEKLRRVVDQVLQPHMNIHFQLTMPHVVGVYELFTCGRDWPADDLRN